MGGLAFRLILGGGLPVNHGGGKGGTLAKDSGAYPQVVFLFNHKSGALVRLADRRHGVKHYKGRGVASNAQKVAEVIEGVKVKGGCPDGD